MLRAGSRPPLEWWKADLLPVFAVVAALLLGTGASAYAERTVNLTVTVLDSEGVVIEGATVTVTPSSGQETTHQTDQQGEVSTKVTMPDAWTGEGLFSSVPTLSVVAKKGGVARDVLIKLPSSAFRSGVATRTSTITLIPILTKTVELEVAVKDEQGGFLPGTRVNVYSNQVSKLHLLTHRRGFVAPPAYQADTTASGTVTFRVAVGSDGKADLALEVSREDRSTEKRDIALDVWAGGVENLSHVEEFRLSARASDSKGPVITVGIDVTDANYNPIENATVIILDSSLGMATGRFTGVTGPDGRALIRVLYGSADSEGKVDLDVSKNGYKTASLSLTLRAADVGKTVRGRSVALETLGENATQLTVAVNDPKTRDGIPDAKVILDGPTYVSDTTNTSGKVTLMVSEPGDFELRVSQDNYRAATSAVRIGKEEMSKDVSIDLEEKMTKDEGDDQIEITVLARDPTDEKSKPAPLPGAQVKAGRISTSTDDSGIATLKGAFAESQEITVSARGFVGKNATVRVAKVLHYGRGTGKAVITLDPDLSEDSPIRLVVDVNDGEKPVSGAEVGFLLPLEDELLFGGRTGQDGEQDFRSSDVPGVTIATLRKGLRVKVQKKGYKDVLTNVPAGLLLPSTEARRFSVSLDRDWSAAEEEIAALEGKVDAWRNDRTMAASPEHERIAKALRERAWKLDDAISQAAPDFNLIMGPGPALDRLRKVKDLQETIRKCLPEAEDQGNELTRLLEDAKAAADRCASVEDPKLVRARYQAAIKLLGEIGVRNKRAVKARDELLPLATESLAMQQKLKELEAALQEFETLAKEAEANAAAAKERFEQQTKRREGLLARHDVLQAEVAALEKRADAEAFPIPLVKRIGALIGKLDLNNVVELAGPPERPGEAVTNAAEEIRSMQAKAERALAVYRTAAGDVDTLAGTLEAIDKIFWDANAEIGLAVDLLKRADECEMKHAALGLVMVPDLSPLGSLEDMMTVAKHAGLVPALVAISAQPPASSTRLFAGQEPAPNSKATKGSPLKILVYQKLAQPGSEDVSVPDLSAFATVAEMKAALAHAGLTPAFSAKGKPPTKEQEFKFAGQSPAAGTKVQRTSVVSVSIYQKFEADPAGTTVTVPAIFTGNAAETAKSALASVGLIAAFNAKGGKPPVPDLEYKTTGALDPPAGTKVAKGSTVTVSIYQKYEAPSEPPLGPPSSGLPNLVGLTLEQAVARLPAGTRIGSDEIGDKPPSPEKALTIFWQDPPAGTKLGPAGELVFKVKRYGSAGTSISGASGGSDLFLGTWIVKGDNFYGRQEVTIAKQPDGSYVLTPQGHQFGYPVQIVGNKMSHQHGLWDITWILSGDTMQGTGTGTDIRGGAIRQQSTLQRK